MNVSVRSKPHKSEVQPKRRTWSIRSWLERGAMLPSFLSPTEPQKGRNSSKHVLCLIWPKKKKKGCIEGNMSGWCCDKLKKAGGGAALCCVSRDHPGENRTRYIVYMEKS